MISLKSPNSIPGLNLWFDAADINTINNGRVVNNENVYKFTDKISGVSLTNGNTVSGPTYSFGSINGKNAIHFPHYGLIPNNRSLKTLTASNVSQLNTFTFSMFVVYKPTTKLYQDLSGNQSYVISVFDGLTIDNLVSNVFPNRAFYIGDEGGGSQGQRNNPSGRYVEGISTGVGQYVAYTENITSRSLELPTPAGLSGPSSNQVTIASARGQNGLRKVGWIQQNGESLEDLTIPVSTTIGTQSYKPPFGGIEPPRTPSPFSSVVDYYRNRGYLLSGNTISAASRPGTRGTHLTLGGFWPNTTTFTFRTYPFEGYICEFLNYNRYLTEQETNSVREYLKIKWFPS
jgi:hypothetical protein